MFLKLSAYQLKKIHVQFILYKLHSNHKGKTVVDTQKVMIKESNKLLQHVMKSQEYSKEGRKEENKSTKQ